MEVPSIHNSDILVEGNPSFVPESGLIIPPSNLRPNFPSLFNEVDAKKKLWRRKAGAGLLLASMAAIAILCESLPLSWAWLSSPLGDAAKAGTVGGIADWFAVTALFRRPLGLPIPHTGVLPRQKERIGRSLGSFFAGHLLTPDEIGRATSQIDVPTYLGKMLSDPKVLTPLSSALAELGRRILSSQGSGLSVGTTASAFRKILSGEAVGKLAAHALRLLIEGGHHQAITTSAAGHAARMLKENRERVSHILQGRIRERGGRLFGWAVAAPVANKILDAISIELNLASRGESELNAALDEWLLKEISFLEANPSRLGQSLSALINMKGKGTISALVKDASEHIERALEQDGGIENVIRSCLKDAAHALCEDPKTRQAVSHTLETTIANELPKVRDRLSNFISEIIANWDSTTLMNRIELRVGPDLQWIRVNGTVVGFLAGGLLHWLLLLCHHI
jgi:uncharacterized membrane-anchored protein YjiN (DUF445 family)